MAEPTPGAPGGGGSSGPRSATAATFQVNDGSLKGLHTTFRTLIKDVNEFNQALQNLTKGAKTVDAIHAKLSGLGMAGSGSSSGGSTGSAATGGTGSLGGTTHFTNNSTGQQVNIGGDAHFTNTGAAASQAGEEQRTGRFSVGQKRVGAAVLGGVAAVGGYFNRSMGDISDLNLAYTQAAQGRGYTGGRANDARTQLMKNVGGYQSAQDLLGGTSTITSAIGSQLGSGRSNQITTAVGQLAAAMPGMGYAGAAAGASQLYNPAVAQRLRSVGATQAGSRGKLSSPATIYNQIQRMVFRGQKVTPQMISEGMQPGAPLFVTLQGLGLDETGMEAFRQYALTQANLGGSQARTEAALQYTAVGHGSKQAERDAKSAGLTTSIRSGQNRAGLADTRRTGEAERESGDAVRSSFYALAHASDLLTKSFAGLNHYTGGLSGGALGTAGVLGGPVAGALSAVGGVAGAGFAAQSLSAGWRALRGGGGGRGGRGRAASALGGVASGALGASGVMGTPVFVTNWPGGGYGGGGGGGGGGLGDLTDMLGPNETGQQHGPQMSRRMRAGRFLGKWAGRAGRFGGGGMRSIMSLGRGGTTLAEVSGMGLAEGIGAVAAPLAVAAGVGYGLGKGAESLIHHGALSMFGAASDSKLAEMDRFANDHSLMDAMHKLTTEGYMAIPAAKAEWQTVVKPLVHKAIQSRKQDDEIKALQAIGQLKRKFRAQVEAKNTSGGKTAKGEVQHSIFDTSGTGKYTRGSNYGQETGDGPGGIASRGPNTVNTIESLMTGGPPNRIASTVRPGAHTVSGGLSFHATGNAVDFAGPKPSRDSNELLAINKHFAQKYGKGLKELIYAGPGGVNLLNGKPHIFSKAVQDLHHDHVHVAATQDSLKSIGGVATSEGAQNAADAGNSSPSSSAAAAPTANAPGIMADEASAFASILNQRFGSGGNVASAVRKSSPAGSASTGGAANAGSDTGSTPSTPVSGTVGSWIKSALGIMHLDVDKYGSAIATIIQHESSGNPRAQNNWDSNAKAGHPSKGIMQTIDSTFNAHALPGHGDIWNPVDNIIAATRYAISRYGSMDKVPGIYSLTHGGPYKGYLQGAWNTPEGPAMLHADEMVLPAKTARRVRGMIARNGAAMGGGGMTGGGGGDHRCTVSITAPITVVGKATQQDAVDFLGMVKREAEQNHILDSIGAG